MRGGGRTDAGAPDAASAPDRRQSAKKEALTMPETILSDYSYGGESGEFVFFKIPSWQFMEKSSPGRARDLESHRRI